MVDDKEKRKQTKKVVESVIQIHGMNLSKCGYCKSPSGSMSYGVLSNTMLAEDYESLMLVGWRRSGTILYIIIFACIFVEDYEALLHVSWRRLDSNCIIYIYSI
jgi:arginyl-tRNA--protein-N-Asp/Glu arginylyltransferase